MPLTQSNLGVLSTSLNAIITFEVRTRYGGSDCVADRPVQIPREQVAIRRMFFSKFTPLGTRLYP